VTGLTISVVGLYLISNIEDGSVTTNGLFLALAGAFFWTLANAIIKKSKTDNPLSFVVWSGVLPAIAIFVGYYFLTKVNPFVLVYNNLNQSVIFSIAYQAYANTLLGYLIWVTLLSKNTLSVSAPTYILVPVFSLFFSYLIHDEPIGTTKIIALILIISGAVITTAEVKGSSFRNDK
jgi:O-acetylserine/cysteine efflux transporter